MADQYWIEELQACPVCECVMDRGTPECPICSWQGSFHLDPLLVGRGLRALLVRCPSIPADSFRGPEPGSAIDLAA